MQIHGTYVDNKKLNTSKRYMISALEALKENDFLMIQKRDSAFFVELL